MTLLSADLSDPLLELFHRQPALVDGLEVGPWFSPDQVRAYRQALPDVPFTFHGMDLLVQVGFDPEAIPRIAAYVAASGSPWVSVHLGLWPLEALEHMRRSQVPLPLPDPERAAHRLVQQVKQLSQSLLVPILLENVSPLPFPGCEFEVQPELIQRLIAATGCALLLDLGHARISAAALGVDIHTYLSSLPLERVEQVHVSGPRLQDGRLYDAHEPLQPEDYALLEFILDRTHPRWVTLEYIRRPDALYDQLIHLRHLLELR